MQGSVGGVGRLKRGVLLRFLRKIDASTREITHINTQRAMQLFVVIGLEQYLSVTLGVLWTNNDNPLDTVWDNKQCYDHRLSLCGPLWYVTCMTLRRTFGMHRI